jgi:hypothetical protein
MNTGPAIYTLAEAKELTGVARHLITYLIQDRKIPFRMVGIAKVIDEAGLDRLKEAIVDYQSKLEPVPA